MESSFSLSKSNISVSENGILQNADVRCGDTASAVNVMFCLDASGSMQLSFPDLKAAAKDVIDSLPLHDRVGIVSFGSSTKLEYPLSTDKEAVKRAIDSMRTSGSTAMYDALDSAIARMGNVSGEKYIVLLTDGVDNMSKTTLDRVAKRIRDAGIVIIAISFGDPGRAKEDLQRLALQSNGLYYTLVSQAQLLNTFRDISGFLRLDFCDLSYTTARCADSLRAVRVEAASNQQRYFADTTIASPALPQAITLRVDAPSILNPGSGATISLNVLGTLAPSLFAFEIHLTSPGNYFPINPAPVTTGTIIGDQAVTILQPNPSELVISSGGIYPRQLSGTLLSLFLPIPIIDSSRSYPIVITSAILSQGCDIQLSVINDTIEVCACRKRYSVRLDTGLIVSAGAELLVPLYVDLQGESQRTLEIYGTLHYDSSKLTFVGFRTTNTLLEGGLIQTTSSSSNLVAFHAVTQIPVTTDVVPICMVLFAVNISRESASTLLALDSVRVYARCCPDEKVHARATPFSPECANASLFEGPV
ncbi:MAG: VWA domain-containing protein [Ignavibacteria bacterium]|nr:VWA domain-containing protein [Ignavibacteria bacterium]